MTPPQLMVFVDGAISIGFLIVGMFFLRFWRRTGDTLFAVFALAFAFLAAGQATTVLPDLPEARGAEAYFLRLFAFGLIIAAVLAKNLKSRRRDRIHRRLG